MKIKNVSHGFTLVEILIVVGIIVVLFGGVIISSNVFRNQLNFNSSVNNIKNIADMAKNYALSTLSYPDTSDDIDHDGKICPEPIVPANCDKILPNGYIVNFDSSTGETVKVSLYADVFGSVINSLDTGDQLIRSIELPENINLTPLAGTKAGSVYILTVPDNFSVLYTVTNAEFYVLGTTPQAKDNLQIYLTQTDSKGTIMRDKYIYFQNLNNTAQITDAIMLEVKPSP